MEWTQSAKSGGGTAVCSRDRRWLIRPGMAPGWWVVGELDAGSGGDDGLVYVTRGTAADIDAAKRLAEYLAGERERGPAVRCGPPNGPTLRVMALRWEEEAKSLDTQASLTGDEGAHGRAVALRFCAAELRDEVRR